jgi:uncharacterized repeat protein (TIGR01451 family)
MGMSPNSRSKRSFVMTNSRLRRLTVEGVLLALVAMLAVLGLQRAHAVTAGGFEIDGNIVSNGDSDWSTVGGQPLTVDGVNNGDSNIFFGGSKEDDPNGWQVHAGQPPSKDDIGYIYGYAHRFAGHEWADIAFERVGTNGTTLFTLELNQKHNKTNSHGVSIPDRTDGDLRLTIIQHGNGDFTVSGTVDRYSNGSFHTLSPPAGLVVGASNDSAIAPINAHDPIANIAGKIPAGHFAEVAFDLTGLNNLTSDTCRAGAFSVANGRSQASETENPELKDFIHPIDISIPSDCASLQITKSGPDGNTPAPGATFTVSPDPTTGDEGTVTVTDGAQAGNGNDIDDPDGKADGVIDLTAQPGHDYTVTEVTPPPGYFLGATTEISHEAGSQSTVHYDFSDPLGSVTFQKTDGEAALCCATFHVVATSGPAKDADVDVTVKDNGAHDASAVAGTIKVTNLPKGDYEVSETVSPAGYTKDTSTKSFTIGPDQESQEGPQNKDVTLDEPFVDQPIPVVPTGEMKLIKSVSPTETAEYGDTLTYSMVATATGTLDEQSVVVSDVVPDKTSYVSGSASCVATPCTPSYDAATHTVHWALGDMTHGSSRTVSFQVTIDKPATTGSLPAETITNVGSVASTEDPSTLSNEVKTVVTAVLGLHITLPQTPVAQPTLPVTGRNTGLLLLVGLALIGTGTVMTVCARAPRQHVTEE